MQSESNKHDNMGRIADHPSVMKRIMNKRLQIGSPHTKVYGECPKCVNGENEPGQLSVDLKEKELL